MARKSGRSSTNARRKGRAADNDGVAAVYKEMLNEVAQSSHSEIDDDGRALKRRRTRRPGGPADAERESEVTPSDLIPGSQKIKEDRSEDLPSVSVRSKSHSPVQTAYAEIDSSSESTVDWEEVDLEAANDEEVESSEENETGYQGSDLVLDLASGLQETKPKGSKRRLVTAAESRLRLEIHKMHVLCLLAFVDIRNDWCNDDEVQATLKPLLSSRTISYLNPDPKLSQFQRSRSFIDGLEQACQTWKSQFKKTARGLKRSAWANEDLELHCLGPPDDIEVPLEKKDFKGLAKKLESSRDVGAQLFCALLRSVGVKARLVCSLQPLPFGAAASKRISADGVNGDLTAIARSNRDVSSGGEGTSRDDSSNPRPSNVGASGTGGRTRRLGQTGFSNPPAAETGIPPPVQAKPKRIRESRFPVFWAEGFNAALQKWIPVDPLVTETVAKPTKFEPPAGEPENNMTYVLAFEDDGVARDVTRRYAKAYNAKTRRSRVEFTRGGDRWWRNVLDSYSRGWDLDRDQVEDAELASKEAQEPMPRNVQDFKNHPYFALERHLKRSEVIHPQHEVGKIAAGKASKGPKTLESIYRRRDVCTVKSAGAWYRLGREVKPGEQPIKHSKARRDDDDSGVEEESEANTGLYGEFQTTVYRAPRVINGRVPKNSYGNLDMFVSSMVPEGGTRFADSEAVYAARLLGIDYADAVTGFEFKGRHGTAVNRGIVAATEYQQAIELIICAIRDEKARAETAQKSAECRRLWRHFLTSLRIKKRIEGYEIEGEDRDNTERQSHSDAEPAGHEGGGFIPEPGQEAGAEPTAGQYEAASAFSQENNGASPSNVGDHAGLRSYESHGASRYGRGDNADKVDREPTVEGNDGGFLPGDSGGGFIPEETSPPTASEQQNSIGQIQETDSEDEDIVMQKILFESAKQAENRASREPTAPEDLMDTPEFDAAQSLAQQNDSTFEKDPNGPGDHQIARKASSAHSLEPPGELYHSRHNLPDLDDSAQVSYLDEENEMAEKSDEQGSLLSHDPEDEDAEPEWLA